MLKLRRTPRRTTDSSSKHLRYVFFKPSVFFFSKCNTSTFQAMDKAAIEKRVLEEDLNELEREKVMLEYELDNAGAKHKADLRNLEIQLAGAKDTESDLMQRIDLMNKDNEELASKVRALQDEMEEAEATRPAPAGENELEEAKAELVKTQKLLSTEKLLKQQAVNKLAEIMNRKDIFLNPGKNKNKNSSSSQVLLHRFFFPFFKSTNLTNCMILQELRKKEKENRKLQQELKLEKDKFDQMVSKYVKEVQDLHASIYEESQWKNKLQMELDTKVNAF